MIGTKVRHKIFGVGTITAKKGRYITVEFPNKTTQFPYPDAFEKFLEMEDTGTQAKSVKRINNTERGPVSSVETGVPYRSNVRPLRVGGRRMVFFVFQGKTFRQEYQGGYIWAPISNKAGVCPHHWTRLLDVREGDIILHGSNGYIQAISVARGSCYECAQPRELEVEELWERNGRRVDCDYIRITCPIKTSHYVSDILRLSRVKNSPFNSTGSGNMGYLFEINRELARIFVRESVALNPYLKSVDYINELLSEDEKL